MGRAFEYRRAAKEKRWDKMSKVFPKLGKLITIAAREGGPDPLMCARMGRPWKGPDGAIESG